MTISKIDVNGQIYDIVDKRFEEKEEVISAALNDINSRIEEKEETISAALNDLNTRIVENEEVISASLNDLNQRISNGGSSLTLATVATTGSYNDLSNKPDLSQINQSILDILNILGMQSPEDYVDLGLPSGCKWAKGNIVSDGNGGYKIGEPTDYGAYFSWGNIVPHFLPNDRYSFDQTNYDSSPGASLTADIASNDATHDAALACLGDSARMPTKEEFQELYDNTDMEWVTIDGVKGWKFMKKSDYSVFVFFPAAGYRYDLSLTMRDSYGMYWSSSYYDSDYEYYLDFSRSEMYPQSTNGRMFGYSVRAVYSGNVLSRLEQRITALENNNSN